MKFIPHEIFEMPAKLLLAEHPDLKKSHALVGLSVKIIETEMLRHRDGFGRKTGQHGGIGAVSPAEELFHDAYRAIESGVN